MPKLRTYSQLVRHPPPSCTTPTRGCGAPNFTTVCTCDAKPFFIQPHGDLLPAGEASKLRIFFFDGHSGPMNDMIATFMRMGVSPDNIDGMLMAQAEQKRSFINVFSSRLIGAPPNAKPEKCRTRLLDKRTSRRLHNWLRGTHTTAQGGDCTLLPQCERKRCRDSLISDGLRIEFARQFGAAFERSVDVVACNFPSWQCALFMYVNVAVVMRFTHRWDHHLQSYYADPGVQTRPASTWSERGLANVPNASSVRGSHSEQPSKELAESIRVSMEWKAARQRPRGLGRMIRDGRVTPLAKVALHSLRTMAVKENVVFAASNPYDDTYLRRAFEGAPPPVPWPGTAFQLADIRYSGERAEIIFCCGNTPYNSRARYCHARGSHAPQYRVSLPPPLT
jgi:hypothetical protein